MGVKWHNGKWQVDLRSTYIKTVDDEQTATMLFQHGQYLLALGKPLSEVRAELRGETVAPCTLDAFADTWLSQLTTSQETKNKYRVNYNRVSRLIGHRPIDSLTPPDIRHMVAALSSVYAPKTVSVSVAVLRSILADAIEAGLITKSPATRITNMPRLQRVRDPKVLTRDEYRVLIAATPERWQPLIALLPLTGLRIGEASALKWHDISDGRVHVTKQYSGGKLKLHGKTASARRHIDLPPSAFGWLAKQEEYRSPRHDLVFGAVEGGYLRYDIVSDIFRDLRDTVGFDIKPHDLRHTFGSWLLRSGADIVYVSKRLGHKTPAFTLKVYSHEIDERDERAPKRLDGWLNGDETGTTET